jgi:hypothetical protein
MKAFVKRRGAMIQVALGLFVTGLAASGQVGEPARLVNLLAIGAGCFGAGVGLGLAIAGRRLERDGRGRPS